ncbi:hypothetical protein D3C81_1480530 [compost metagenome]
MDLGGAVGTFHFDVLQTQGTEVGEALGALLPPEVAEQQQQQQQHRAGQAQHGTRQAQRLGHVTETMHGTAGGIGTGIAIELLDQGRLLQAQQLGIGTDVAAGKGMPGQTVEFAGFQLRQGLRGQVELGSHLGHLPTLVFPSQTQDFTRVAPLRRCACFGMRRHGHFCSARYC